MLLAGLYKIPLVPSLVNPLNVLPVEIANRVLLTIFVTTKLPSIDGIELVSDKLITSPILTLLGVLVVISKLSSVVTIDVTALLPIAVSVLKVISPFPVLIVCPEKDVNVFELLLDVKLI